jgi:hypothetical protein
MFAVCGTHLYELSAAGVATVRGIVADDHNPASLAASGTQLLVASGGNIYVLTLATNAFQQIQSNAAAGTGPVGSISQVAYADGYFIAFDASVNEFQLSNLEDATTWNDLYVSQPSVFPENMVAILVAFRELIVFGGSHAVAYYDTGDTNNPWQPVPGGFMEQGCIAAFSPARADNSFFWLGGDERGAGIVWRANGYIPTRVSNHAIEYAINQYPKITDAIGYAYQEKGHTFYVLNFPSANNGLGATWVYDCATGLWHERARWNGNGYEAWHAQWHAYCFGKHLVGDWASGTVFQQSISILTDNGNRIRRMRRAPHISSEQEWIYHREMQIDAEMGLGPIPGLPMPSTNPGAIAIQNSVGAAGALTAEDNGNLQWQANPNLAAQPIYLNDMVLANTSWQLTINAAAPPGLVQTKVSYNANYPTQLLLATTGTQLNAVLSIANGMLQQTQPYPSIRDPQIMLRWSDDGGKTWSNEYWESAGQAGTYKTRAHWHRLGRSRDRIYEMVVSDPIDWRIIDAYLDATPGFGHVERMNKNLAKMA